MSRPWVVLKYGGTSVARAANWKRIAERIRTVAATHRVCVVASALAGVSDALERAVAEALSAKSTDSLSGIREQHRRLAGELELSDDSWREAAAVLDELETRLDGVRKTGEAPPRLMARILGGRWPHLAGEHLFHWSPAALVRFLTERGFAVEVIRTGVRKTFTTSYLRSYASVVGAWLPPGLGLLPNVHLRIPTGEMLALASRA